MKKISLAFLILGLFRTDAFSECSYFRVSAHLVKCAAADAKIQKSPESYPSNAEIPELEDTADHPLLQVSCSCEYSLMGSDPRCDTDQSIEKSSVLGGENPAHPCRRGSAICRDLCPPRLP